ncbi:MAG TPA: hypothetical protein VE397_21415, partial [Stellaceae bacterium]|nr:hypothetical protein [Stellaceae bacterium]
NVTCGGQSVGLEANGVTFVIGGKSTVNCAGTANTAFCVANGYNSVSITAPSSGNTEDLAVIGPTPTTNTAGATFAGGAAATVSGAFYFPNGVVSLSGAGKLQNAQGSTGQCLTLIGSAIDVTQGGSSGTTCTGIAGVNTGVNVALVQ